MKYYFTFSEAIRDGAGLHPQGFWSTFKDGRTCGLGAGYAALGLLGAENAREIVFELYPYMKEIGNCPACLLENRSLLQIVRHLNDLHVWTREENAGWLETEEEKLGYVMISESVESESLVTVGVG